MITPQWNDLLQALEGLAFNERSYPYTYQDLPMLKLFVYALAIPDDAATITFDRPRR